MLLCTALDTLTALECRCGCGQYADIAHDPDTDGEWVVVDDEVICYAGAALERWRDDDGHKGTEPGAQVFVRRVPPERRSTQRGLAD